MLTIQPYSTVNRNLRTPSFKSEWNEDTIKAKRAEIEQQSEAFDKVLSDDYVPEKIKKPFKFFKMIYSAALDGISVFGAVLLLKKPLKSGMESKFVTGALKKAQPMAASAAKGVKYIGEKLVKGFELLGNVLKSTKLGEKVVGLFDKFAQTKLGTALTGFGSKVAKVAKTGAEKILQPMKKMTFDKVTNSTAAVLGIGSGAAGAYEAHIEEHPVDIANVKAIDKADVADNIEDTEYAEILDEDSVEVA